MAKALSQFNLFMRKKIKSGMSFARAAKSWRGKGKRLKRTTGGINTMVRRGRSRGSRRSSRRISRRGGRRGGMMGGLNGITNMVQSAGMSAAVGAGTKMLVEQYSDLTGVQAVKPFAKYIGAYAAFKTGGMIPGGLAALPLALGPGGQSAVSSGNQTVL